MTIADYNNNSSQYIQVLQSSAASRIPILPTFPTCWLTILIIIAMCSRQHPLYLSYLVALLFVSCVTGYESKRKNGYTRFVYHVWIFAYIAGNDRRAKPGMEWNEKRREEWKNRVRENFSAGVYDIVYYNTTAALECRHLPYQLRPLNRPSQQGRWDEMSDVWWFYLCLSLPGNFVKRMEWMA